MIQDDLKTLDDKARHAIALFLEDDEDNMRMVDMRRWESHMRAAHGIDDERAEKWLAKMQIEKKLALQVVGARCFICLTNKY